MSLLLRNANLYAPEPLGPGSVLIEDGRISAVYRIGEKVPDRHAIDLGGAILGPGFIDVHTHGADGVDFMEGGDAAWRMARFFVRHGVTGFVPATVTAPFEAIERAVAAARRLMADQESAGSGGDEATERGARVLGVHLEGPFLSPRRLGAQSPEFCISPVVRSVEQLLDVAGDVVRIVTLAPEEDEGLEVTRTLGERGIVVSLGHTVATAEQALAAFAAGASQVTHLFNGMPPMHHRQPGVVGAALTTKGVMVEIIADGIHLAPMTICLAVAAKDAGEVLLVTDSMAATGCADGEYVLGSVKVVVRHGEARLESGELASSTLTLDRAVINVARWTNVGLGGAWRMASLNPACQLGIADRVGRLTPGYDADLAAIDADGRVILTMIGGETAYWAGEGT